MLAAQIHHLREANVSRRKVEAKNSAGHMTARAAHAGADPPYGNGVAPDQCPIVARLLITCGRAGWRHGPVSQQELDVITLTVKKLLRSFMEMAQSNNSRRDATSRLGTLRQELKDFKLKCVPHSKQMKLSVYLNPKPPLRIGIM